MFRYLWGTFFVPFTVLYFCLVGPLWYCDHIFGNDRAGCFVLVVVGLQHVYCFIGLDKSGYQVNSFLISRRKHMLWVLIRSASARRF